MIIDTVILNGVASSEGTELSKSLLSLKNSYQPVPPPPFIPVDFGDASRIQNQINVALTALCNCPSTFLCLFAFIPRLTVILILAFERTLPQLKEMVELGGFKIKKVHATR